MAGPAIVPCSSHHFSAQVGPRDYIPPILRVASKFKKCFSTISLLCYLNAGVRFTIIFSANVCYLVLHFGARYLSATIICSEYYCTSKNWSIIHMCIFCLLVCLKWRFIVCSALSTLALLYLEDL